MQETLAPTLDPFQLETLDFLDHAGGRAVLADPMGARKTATTLCWLARAGVQRTLVVAPSAVHGHWLREAERFYPAAARLHGSGTKGRRTKTLEAAKEGGASWPVIYLTTYESMKSDQHTIHEVRFDAVVFDEGHRLKGRRTQVALCANDVTKGAKHIICATGTPVLNHAAELWQYLHMLAPRLYPAYWRWVEEHYRVEVKTFRGNRFPTRIIHGFRPGHDEIVRNQLAPFFIQRDITELFPGAAWTQECEHVEIEVELSAAERKAYDNLVKHDWLVVGGKEITTANPLDKNTRFEQLASDWGALCAEAEEGTKVKAAIELIADLVERDEQVVVFAKYKATVQRIVAGLVNRHISAAAYTGDVKAELRDQLVSQFGKGKLKVIVGTLASLSEGVDGLQCASHIVMVDRWWTPGKNDQAFGRCRRSGQLKRVTVWHIFAAKTIDETIVSACLRKVNVVQLLRGLSPKTAVYGRAGA
jgi:SNF2 family DNA or RNA helicase